MSSHHIVREKQEPALYIHDFNNFDDEYLGQLLEWSPTLIVAESQYEKAISLCLKVHVVFGNNENTLVQENTKFIPVANSKLQNVVRYLVEEQYPAVNIISTEDKFDDLACFLPEINIVLFTETAKSYAIKTGFSIWKPKDSIFLIDVISYFETTNLKREENGSFVVQQDGFVSFNFTTEYLFVSEQL